MPAISPVAKPTSWPCGTALASGGVRLVRHRTGQSAHRVSLGRRPRRPRRRRRHRDLRGVPRRYVDRELRADRLGRGADRTRPRGRPSPAASPICDGVAVLACRDGSRTASATARQARRFSAAAAARCRSAWTAGLAVRTWPSGSPSGGSRCAGINSQRGRDATRLTRACLVFALTIGGFHDEAVAVADRFDRCRRGHRQSPVPSHRRCWPTATPWREADPVRALDASAGAW